MPGQNKPRLEAQTAEAEPAALSNIRIITTMPVWDPRYPNTQSVAPRLVTVNEFMGLVEAKHSEYRPVYDPQTNQLRGYDRWMPQERIPQMVSEQLVHLNRIIEELMWLRSSVEQAVNMKQRWEDVQWVWDATTLGTAAGAASILGIVTAWVPFAVRGTILLQIEQQYRQDINPAAFAQLQRLVGDGSMPSLLAVRNQHGRIVYIYPRTRAASEARARLYRNWSFAPVPGRLWWVRRHGRRLFISGVEEELAAAEQVVRGMHANRAAKLSTIPGNGQKTLPSR